MDTILRATQNGQLQQNPQIVQLLDELSQMYSSLEKSNSLAVMSEKKSFGELLDDKFKVLSKKYANLNSDLVNAIYHSYLRVTSAD